MRRRRWVVRRTYPTGGVRPWRVFCPDGHHLDSFWQWRSAIGFVYAVAGLGIGCARCSRHLPRA